jgi:hypothetical protein
MIPTLASICAGVLNDCPEPIREGKSLPFKQAAKTFAFPQLPMHMRPIQQQLKKSTKNEECTAKTPHFDIEEQQHTL